MTYLDMLLCGWVLSVVCPLRHYVHIFLIKMKQSK